MRHAAPGIRELEGCQPGSLPVGELLDGGVPVVLRGVVQEWALVQAGLRGTAEAMDLLRGHDGGRPVAYSYGAPDVAGRPFYNDDFTAINCEVRRSGLGEVLDQIAAHLDDPHPPTFYVASLPIDGALPGLREGNDLDLAGHGIEAPPSIWIGNRVTASCHYDAPNNIACCAVGRRRFTVFPPEQIDNLYPGPLEPTPGGQAVSVVDFAAPDLERYPRFREALAHAQSTVLEPGGCDLHPRHVVAHVQGLMPHRARNYWWSSALRTSRCRCTRCTTRCGHPRPPAGEKDAWRAVSSTTCSAPRSAAESTCGGGAQRARAPRRVAGAPSAPC